MANYNNTKATIAANVYTNHNNEITAAMVKAGINAVVDTLIAGGFLYKGVATTSTNPGSPDANVFYIATAPGTYTNFGSLVVNDGEVAILKYNGSWSKEVTGAATAAEVSALSHEVDDLDGAVNGEETIVTETVTLAQITTLTSSGLIKDDGVTIQASGAGIHTDAYIDITDCSNMVVTGWASNNKIIFFYDADKVFISYALSGKNSAQSVTIPPTAKYIRVNGLTASYLAGQSASEFATNVTATKTTIVHNGGLLADVAELKPQVAANTADIAALKRTHSGKYLHISFDDAYRIFKYLQTDSPATIFEEPRMALCKQLHDTYGAVFSFYFFNDEINPDTEAVIWAIESTPSTYKAQFEACRDWLKFGYHTKNRNTNANNFTTAELTADYARFISVMQNCVGLGSLDRCPRLGGYNGSLDRMLALRDTNAGILGLLGPDDARTGYYMTHEEAAWLNTQDRWRDYEHQLVIVKTDLRMEDASVRDDIESVLAGWETAAAANKVRELLVFTHEGVVFVAENNIPDNLEAICAWAIDQGYDFDFPQNRIW